MSHTPGPWEVTPAKWQGKLQHADYKLWNTKVETESEAWANARLIAAAPDLLAACEGMLEWARRVSGRTPGMEIAQAKAAIAKAKATP